MHYGETLKLETKAFDGNDGGHGYLYGLNQRISDKDFELVKPLMKDFKESDFKEIAKVCGRPEGWRCLKENVSQIEEILKIEKTIDKHENKIKELLAKPETRQKVKDNAMDGIVLAFRNGGLKAPEKLSNLVQNSAKIYDPDDYYLLGELEGYGSLFIYSGENIWYIINNSTDDDEKSINNIEIPNGGAIGYKVPYNSGLDELIRIVSEDNIYHGRKLFRIK